MRLRNRPLFHGTVSFFIFQLLTLNSSTTISSAFFYIFAPFTKRIKSVKTGNNLLFIEFNSKAKRVSV